MDSISITIDRTIANNHGLLFTIIQDSIRFERMKRFAVYDDRRLLGVYSLASKVVFELAELPRMVSHLILGCDESEGVKILKTFKVKGRTSDQTKMALVSLLYEFSDPKYEFNKIRT